MTPRLIGSFAFVTLLVASAGTAAAAPILVTSVFTPDSPGVTLNAGVGYTYEHNLPADFNPDWDMVSGATLTLSIEGIGGGQALTVNFDGVQVFNDSLKVLLADGGQPLPVAFHLLNDGILVVTLTKGGGLGNAFTFYGSTLTIYGSEEGVAAGAVIAQQISVSEPASLALFALGLLGAGMIHRRHSGGRS